MFRTQRLAILLALAVATLASFDANATVRYVRVDGSNDQRIYIGRAGWISVPSSCHDPSRPCSSISHAIRVASNGDHIKVARGRYSESLNAKADSRYSNKTDVVIQGGFGSDFMTHNDRSTSTTIENPDGPHTFSASGLGTLALTFKDLELFLSGGLMWKSKTAMQITSGNVTNLFGSYRSLTKRGRVNLTFRNVWLVTGRYSAGAAIEATSGRFSQLTLNLIDVVSNVSIKATARSYTGPPSLANDDWSHMYLQVQGSRIQHVDGRAALDVLARGSNAQALVSVRESEILGNHGDGVSVEGEEGGRVSLDIVNSFLVENEGDGLVARRGEIDASVHYSTITRNGRGILAISGVMDLMNTIVWGNDHSSDIGATGAIVSASYSDVGGVFASNYQEGPGVVNLDPRFARIDVPNWSDDYHLSGDSPLIDRGLCGDAPHEVDFDGEERPMGRGCEIGADEVRPALGVFSTPFTPTPLLLNKFSQPTGR